MASQKFDLTLDDGGGSPITQTLYNKDAIDKLDGILQAQIDDLKDLGHFLGSVATFADLPATAADLAPLIPTINDFMHVRSDTNYSNQLTQYGITAIDGTTGAITWAYSHTISADSSGKMDKVVSATTNDIAIFNNAGQVIDSGLKTDAFILKSSSGLAGAAIISANNENGTFVVHGIDQGTIKIDAEDQTTSAINQIEVSTQSISINAEEGSDTGEFTVSKDEIHGSVSNTSAGSLVANLALIADEFSVGFTTRKTWTNRADTSVLTKGDIANFSGSTVTITNITSV